MAEASRKKKKETSPVERMLFVGSFCGLLAKAQTRQT
jgi:hypothetical protein